MSVPQDEAPLSALGTRGSETSGREARRRKGRPKGWDPLEPAFLAIAVILLVAVAIVPWWRSVLDTSVVPYRTSRGVEFSPWIGTAWHFALLPGGVFRRATALPWWDFGGAFPDYAGYLQLGLTLSTLWTAAFGLALFALLTRREPGPRRHGRPTAASLLSFLLVGASLVVSVMYFPPVAGLSSFAGTEGRLSWGPFFGWYVAMAAGGFLGAATGVGWATDRRLRDLCWNCRRAVAGPTCNYCHSVQ